ncbi:MAG: hypothetical protein H6558_12400 [Lewinellaceae bacterium]|nr:hypothetical protein [Lewinellaceae bacterium]MCB9290948.1 hypothetical protein [Lewinellaceae bacterium]
MWRSISILAAIGLGVFLPVAGQLSFIIRYNLMVMLFLAFLGVRVSRRLLQWEHFGVLAANLSLPLLLFFGIAPFQREIALAVFAIAAAPTAAAAPAITLFLRREVAFVTTSVLLTSTVTALVLPLVLPWVVGKEAGVSVFEVAGPVLGLIFIPLGLSFILKWVSPRAAAWILHRSGFAFLLFLANVFIASAGASAFVRESDSGAILVVVKIALSIFALCLFQFRFGEWMGGKDRPIETGMALGRKNTMFGIWLALAFIHPLAALGPIFYILYQNLYYSWQLYVVRSG